MGVATMFADSELRRGLFGPSCDLRPRPPRQCARVFQPVFNETCRIASGGRTSKYAAPEKKTR
eukprot:12215247-Alexandrium_andersonii.AAC.1